MRGVKRAGGRDRRRLFADFELRLSRTRMHLLRLLHAEERCRQASDFHELKGMFAADAEDNAIVSLLI